MTDPKGWPRNRQRWTAALRDPKRRQTTGELGHQNENGQCCLGVLAEVAGCAYEDGEWDGEVCVAPIRAMDFVGLRTSDGDYDAYSLLGDNDNDYRRGKTFAEIADIIEEEPEGLFWSA